MYGFTIQIVGDGYVRVEGCFRDKKGFFLCCFSCGKQRDRLRLYFWQVASKMRGEKTCELIRKLANGYCRQGASERLNRSRVRSAESNSFIGSSVNPMDSSRDSTLYYSTIKGTIPTIPEPGSYTSRVYSIYRQMYTDYELYKKLCTPTAGMVLFFSELVYTVDSKPYIPYICKFLKEL